MSFTFNFDVGGDSAETTNEQPKKDKEVNNQCMKHCSDAEAKEIIPDWEFLKTETRNTSLITLSDGSSLTVVTQSPSDRRGRTAEPSSDSTAVQPSSDSTVVQLSSDSTVVQPSSDSTTVQPSSDSTVVQPSSDSTVVQLSSDSTVVQLSSDSTPVQLSSDSGEATSPEYTRTGADTAENVNSDLIPHVYEGGFKIWECSIDLIEYLSCSSLPLDGAYVLELGCGAGLPGIYAYKHGAEVTFQDYNKEVLTEMTAHNVVRNTSDTHRLQRCHLVAGDWSHVQQLLSANNHKFDLILTSETIYSQESYSKLHQILEALLKPGGQIYLAAKTYYFGVGGGTREFEEYLDSRGTFSHSVCKQIPAGIPREILKMTFKPR